MGLEGDVHSKVAQASSEDRSLYNQTIRSSIKSNFTHYSYCHLKRTALLVLVAMSDADYV